MSSTSVVRWATSASRSWNEGINLDASQLLDIGRRHWSLEISLYSAEGEEILDAFLRPARERLPYH